MLKVSKRAVITKAMVNLVGKVDAIKTEDDETVSAKSAENYNVEAKATATITDSNQRARV